LLRYTARRSCLAPIQIGRGTPAPPDRKDEKAISFFARRKTETRKRHNSDFYTAQDADNAFFLSDFAREFYY